VKTKWLLLSCVGVLAVTLWCSRWSGSGAAKEIVSPTFETAQTRAAPAGGFLPATRSDITEESTAAEFRPAVRKSVARLTAELCDAFNSLSVDRLRFALTQLLPALVEEDAPAAARLAESITDLNLRGEVIYLVARLWGKKDVEAALTWAGALKIEYEREAALTDAALELAREDLSRALQLSARFFREDEPSPVLENLAQRWAENNFPAALAWTLANSTGPQRDELVARLALVEASHAPRTAAQLVVDEMRPGESQNEAAISVLHQWAQRNVSEAVAWVERFPDGPLRDRANAELKSVAKFRLAAAR
jgi:hypothetical protein